ncbi:MAG: hypothetical protein GY810_19310 [Aureispira sp.]|nr:hypothetical protein [Aureispira sp.]
MKIIGKALLIFSMLYTVIICAVFLMHPHRVTGFMGVCFGVYGGLLAAIGATLLENPNKEVEVVFSNKEDVLDQEFGHNPFWLKGRAILLILVGVVTLVFSIWSINNLDEIIVFWLLTIGVNLFSYILGYSLITQKYKKR